MHVIRRYLGSSSTPQADTRLRLAKDESDTQARSHQGLYLQPGDVLLLCTDGLTNHVEDHEILAAVEGHAPQHACDALIDTTLLRGATDNVTAIAVRYQPGARSFGPRGAWD